MSRQAVWRGVLWALLSACSGTAGETDAAAERPPSARLRNGLLTGPGGRWVDVGYAAQNEGVRLLIGLPVRDSATLDVKLRDIYDVASPEFRRYLTVERYLADHAPTELDVQVVGDWLRAGGLEPAYVASNRQLLIGTGSVAQTEALLGLRLRHYRHAASKSLEIYGIEGTPHASSAVLDRGAILLAADRAAGEPIAADELPLSDEPPFPGILNVAQVARAYRIDKLGDASAGARIGVICGFGFRSSDVRSFWRGQGIERADPIVHVTQSAPAGRSVETVLDIEWAGGVAAHAELHAYLGPDTSSTSLAFAFNEAIARAEVDVLSYSFTHNEQTEHGAMLRQFDASARMAAALGITVVAAAGDSARPNVPCTSPWVTAVGGTEMLLDADGAIAFESAWEDSGCGESRLFEVPAWQRQFPELSRRATSDLALNASGDFYATFLRGEWQIYGGTSFAAPVFAAMVTAINGSRARMALPRVGWLNAALYETPEMRAAFHDVTSGGSAHCPAKAGWDLPTGWGSPRADALLKALP